MEENVRRVVVDDDGIKSCYGEFPTLYWNRCGVNEYKFLEDFLNKNLRPISFGRLYLQNLKKEKECISIKMDDYALENLLTALLNNEFKGEVLEVKVAKSFILIGLLEDEIPKIRTCHSLKPIEDFLELDLIVKDKVYSHGRYNLDSMVYGVYFLRCI